MNAFQIYEDIDLSKIAMRQLISFLKNKKCVRLESISELPLLFVEDYNKGVDAIMSLTNPSLSLPKNCDTPWDASLDDADAGHNRTSPEADVSIGPRSSHATIGTLPHESTHVTHGEETHLSGNQQNVCVPTNCSFPSPHPSGESIYSTEMQNNIGQTDSNLSGNRPSKTCNPSTNTPNCGEDLQLSTPHSTEKNTGFASAERNSGSEDREGIG